MPDGRGTTTSTHFDMAYVPHEDRPIRVASREKAGRIRASPSMPRVGGSRPISELGIGGPVKASNAFVEHANLTVEMVKLGSEHHGLSAWHMTRRQPSYLHEDQTFCRRMRMELMDDVGEL
ncbi:hypothetical protein HGRIS_009657 [Hohenbuehelia grisea]|uniref:Uncharacterized protein n=1 Tax=Hohenbuehelia grisea TaxID=104357 RepID=A0ABR3J244_9AGAR